MIEKHIAHIRKRSSWLLLALVFIGLALSSRSGAGQGPALPLQVSESPFASIVVPQQAIALDRITSEEQEQVIRDALSNLWLYVPDLENHRPQPRHVEAENGQIAYVGTDGHLYLMNPDGTGQHTIVTDLANIADPAWSSDSQWLAFVADGDGGRCLYKLQVTTRVHTPLACGFVAIYEPSWAPDGNHLTFYGKQVEGHLRAWAVPAASGTPIELASSYFQLLTPRWLDNDTVMIAGEQPANIFRLYLIDLAQPDQPRPITPEFKCSDTCTCDENDVYLAYPDLSPDGTTISFVGGRVEGDKYSCTGYYAAYLVDPQGASSPSKIVDVADTTSGVASVGTSQWAPDNRRVGLYANGSDGVMRVNVVDTIIGSLTVLHGREGGGWDGLSWAPDGTQLAVGYLPSDGDPEVDAVDPDNDIFTVLAYGDDPAWGSYPQAPEPFLELPFGYSCQYGDYWNHFGGATEAEFRRAFSYSRAPREVPLPCERSGRVNAFFDHQDPLYPPSFSFGCERTSGRIPITVVTYEGQAFGEGWGPNQRQYSGHPAYDFSTFTGQDYQTPVFAAASGTFDWAGTKTGALTIRLKHALSGGQVYYTEYMHLLEDRWFNEIKGLSLGTAIEAGRRIGTMDSTGIAYGPHLHFEVLRGINGQKVPVDPSGFQPSDEFPLDPWTETFTDGCGCRHSVIAESYYLWVHSLAEDESVAADQSTSLALPSGDVLVDLPVGAVPWAGTANLLAAPDPAPTAWLAGAGHAFYLRVWNAEGEFLEAFLTGAGVSVSYVPNDVADLTPGSVALYWWEPNAGVWQQVPTRLSSRTLSDLERSTLSATATMTQTGLYALLGTPAEDLVAPQTVLTVTGTVVSPGPYYTGTVILAASASDMGGSGLARTECSLDHGQTWQVYTAPLTFNPPYWFDVWMRSVDGIGNIEYPAIGTTIWYEGNRPHLVYLPLVMRND